MGKVYRFTEDQQFEVMTALHLLDQEQAALLQVAAENPEGMARIVEGIARNIKERTDRIYDAVKTLPEA